ncbi:hypothetical protein [Pseudomonas fluorescens]|uniref:Uncharacterized protein n=1 Tax=Pseudomonas fluorescens TaxID=294 RepID=A0A5E7P6Z7_PSEFL|nr:hypothetical protein [Pseudomonas fluorescens]VVP45434.1 hypothetical protein PS880_05072 [Pseudomonas fluorescens]
MAANLDPPTPHLPTGSLQEAWQDIARRLEQARDWNALELRTEHAQGWTSALLLAQVIDLDTYHAMVCVREHLYVRASSACRRPNNERL